MFCNKDSFHGEELTATCTTPKLEDHPLSVLRDFIFNIFTATLHIGGRSFTRNLNTRHTVVTRTHQSGAVNCMKHKTCVSCPPLEGLSKLSVTDIYAASYARYPVEQLVGLHQ
jgi:hypothetical protein